MATRPVGVLSYGPCKGQVGRVAKLLPPSQWQGTRKGTRKGVEIDEQWGFKWPKWGYATQKVAVSSWKWQNLVFYRMCQILPQSHTTRQTKHQNLNVKRLEHGWTWKIPWKDLWKMFLLLLMGVCHGCGVEALQVDPDLVTYSAAVSSCEKAVRWKLALFLGWNLPFFFEPEQYGWFEWQIYIYIHISLRFVRFDHKMYSRNTQPIYEVEHTVWPDLYAFCPTTNPDFFILYPSDVLFDAPISQWGVGSQGTSIFPATSVALSGSFWEPCRGAAEDPSPKVKDFDRQMCLFFFASEELKRFIC